MRTKRPLARKIALLALSILAVAWAPLPAADLPTVSVEHLYYLRARGEYVRRLSAEDMVEYCVTQKIGGRAFEDLYVQLFHMRQELAKLQRVEGASEDDSRVKTLKKTHAVQFELLTDEARMTQKGIVREGHIAADTLEAMGRTQQAR